MTQNHERGSTAPCTLASERSFGGQSNILSDFDSFRRRVAIAGPNVHMMPHHKRTGAPAPPLSHAQKLSFHRAIRRAAVDVTNVNHISNVYHLNRRIEDAYSTTEKAKHPQDPAIYPSYIKRHPNMQHSAVRAEVLGFSSPRELAASQGHPIIRLAAENIHAHAHTPRQDYSRVEEYVAALAAAAPSRSSSAPAVRPQQQQQHHQHPLVPPLAVCRSGVFSDRPSAYSSSHYNHDGGDGYQGLTISGNLLEAFPGGTHRSRASTVASHDRNIHTPKGDRYTPRSGDQYFHSGKFHTNGEHSTYKRAIMSEITESRLYKEKDLQALFRTYIRRAPICDKDTVEAVVLELKLELDVF